MNTNNYSVDNGYRSMLNNFRYNDLQTLLGAFGLNRTGRKSELKDRAIELLSTRPVNINYSAYIAKIYEIYHTLQLDMSNNDNMMRRLSQNQQQQRQMLSVGQMQNPSQRIYQQPQYSQQSMHIVRAGLPQVMPRMQRSMYGNHILNSIPASNMVNTSIQYIAAGNYQPSGTRTIVSHQLPPNQQMSTVAQGALGTTANGNNSYMPSFETIAQIKFKNLPFYEVIDAVIKPTLLTGTERCTLQNVPRDTKEAIFKFTLSAENANFVAANRDISYGKSDYLYQFQIRICQLIEPVPNESPDYMPLGLHIRVGVKSCPLPPIAPNARPRHESRRTARPINCTTFVKLSPIVSNSITINWSPDGKNYIFALYLVKKLTVDTLIRKLQEKGGKSLEETKKCITKKLADVDPDLATTSYRFSLVCPLGKMRMKIPAKSIHCTHLQCFDASTFILMNEKKPTWMCPTCNNPCLYDDIRIENYFLEVITSSTLKTCIKEIEFLADGSWKAYEEIIESKNTDNTTDKLKSIDLDSDDEKCIESKTELSSESSRTQEPDNNLKSSLIDLTLSGDEELPIGKFKQENEDQAADDIKPVAIVDLTPQIQVHLKQAVPSPEQGMVIEINSPSPPSSPTPMTETS